MLTMRSPLKACSTVYSMLAMMSDFTSCCHAFHFALSLSCFSYCVYCLPLRIATLLRMLLWIRGPPFTGWMRLLSWFSWCIKACWREVDESWCLDWKRVKQQLNVWYDQLCSSCLSCHDRCKAALANLYGTSRGNICDDVERSCRFYAKGFKVAVYKQLLVGKQPKQDNWPNWGCWFSLDARVFVSVEWCVSCVISAAVCMQSISFAYNLYNEDPGAYKPDRGGNSSAFANEKADILFLCHECLM